MEELVQEQRQPPSWRAMNADTDSKIEELQFNSLSQMPPWRKIELVGDMNATLLMLAETGLKERHPDATPEQIRRILADKILSKDLALRVYGHNDYLHSEECGGG